MAKESRSWEANDGSLHKTECDAVRRDLEMLIQASPCAENLPYCKTMLGWMTSDARKIAESLIAYADACPQDAVAAEPVEGETLLNRVSAAIGEMQRLGDPAKSWLTRNGFENLNDFVERATEEQVTAWEHFKDEPEAFGNGSKAHGR